MLIIRTEQFQELEETVIKQANLRMVKYAKSRFHHKLKDVSDKKLITFIEGVRVDAKSHGIVNENDVATAVDLTIMYEKDFYHTFWAKDIFSINKLSGEEKMQILRKRISVVVPQL